MTIQRREIAAALLAPNARRAG